MKPLPGYNVEVVPPQEPTPDLVSAQVPAFVGAIPELCASAERVKKDKPIEHFGVMVPSDQRDIIPVDTPIRTKTTPKKHLIKNKVSQPKPDLSAHGVCRDFFRAIKDARPEYKMPYTYSSYDRSEADILLDEMKEAGMMEVGILKALMQWHIRQKLQGHKPLDYNTSVRSLRESWPKFKPMAPKADRPDEAGEKAFNRPVVSQEVVGIGEDITKALKRGPGGRVSALTLYGVICVGHCLLKDHGIGGVTALVSDSLKKLPPSNVRAIYRRTVEYGLPSDFKHALANWRELFKEHWDKANCVSPPATLVSQQSVVVEFVSAAAV